MSKRKSRRQRRSVRVTAQPKASVDAAPTRASQRDLIPTDYSHIRTDLRRIAIFGGGLLAALVVLSFFIQ